MGLMTVQDATRKLRPVYRVSAKWLSEECKTKRLPSLVVNRRILIDVEVVEQTLIDRAKGTLSIFEHPPAQPQLPLFPNKAQEPSE